MRHRGGSWNTRVGRNPAVVADEVEALLASRDLDWLCLQEAGQYVDQLRRQLHGSHRVHAGRGSRSRRDSVVIVRYGLRSRWKRVHPLGGIGWERGNGRPGLHPPRHMTSVRVAGLRGYRVGSVHLAPTPWATRLPRRGDSHARSVRVLRRITRRWSARLVRWVLPGDWNATPHSKFVLDLHSVGEPRGTGIDWVLRSPGLAIVELRDVDHGTSDHRPVIFTVVQPGAHRG